MSANKEWTQQDVDRLLVPRYKVIADYPGTPHYVGSIISPLFDDVANVIMWELHIEKYPHLFRKMEWWDEREPEEMPEYVKHVDGGGVYKTNGASERGMYVVDLVGKGLTHCIFKFLIPATKEEYEAFKAAQQKQGPNQF